MIDTPTPTGTDCACGYPLVQRGTVVHCAVYGARHHITRRRPRTTSAPAPEPRPGPRPLPRIGALEPLAPGDLLLPTHVPFADLAAWVERNTRRPEHLGAIGWIARLADVHRRTVWRWQTCGVLRYEIADEVAARLGVNPATVWGDTWWNPIEVAA